MPLSARENYLRNATFAGPEWIPMNVAFSGATWLQFGKELEEVCHRHPILWPSFKKGEVDYDKMRRPEDKRIQADNWGCKWEYAIEGLMGQVHEHPLGDWANLSAFRPPDPLDPKDTDWAKVHKELTEARARGDLLSGYIEHGFLFLRLGYLRGFENMMMDMAEGPPQFQRLIDMVTAYNEERVKQYLAIGIDILEAGDDLGTQTASICGRRNFHRWITPAYKRLFQPCRQAGVLVALHSDGYTLDLMDEFAECGVSIVNPQDLLHGIDTLTREVKGRFCIRLDIDRQSIVPFGTRREIRALIEEEVRKLGSPQGGLEFICGVYPPTPPENVDALASALEEFRTYWWDGRGK